MFTTHRSYQKSEASRKLRASLGWNSFKKIHFILAYAETIKPFQSHLRHFFCNFFKAFYNTD